MTREIGDLHRLPGVRAVRRQCIQNFERDALGKYLVTKTSKEMECLLICM
jgi:hypothetical protein